MFDKMEWYTKHAKKLDKKYYAKGESIYVLHRRTLQTAKSIIDLIDDIPADDLFLELYMLVKDKEFGIFVGRYQYVLEIAKEKPDTFAEQLYEFYVKMAADIKKSLSLWKTVSPSMWLGCGRSTPVISRNLRCRAEA